MTTDPQRHWESIYRTTAPTEVSWYQPEARLSLDLSAALRQTQRHPSSMWVGAPRRWWTDCSTPVTER